jgi:cytochrome c-type biogenesis protein CcmF
MIANLGFLLLFLAITACFFQISFYFLVKNTKISNLVFKNNLKIISEDFLFKVAKNFTLAISLFCIFSLFCLIYSFITSDFSVLNVYQNSHTLKPLIYKITGAWGNHEGSMLLLVTILSFYSSAFAFFSNDKNINKVLTLNIQAFITFGILAFIIITSSPFIRLFPSPENGVGLNPILQDIGLAAHPPMLYIGYIGFSLIFSMSISALLREKIDKNFALNLRPWLTFSWAFLSLGIGLGSWWAYRELGWGGYWFWDPVENVSLMPWLCATALIHSVIILQKTGNFKIWTIFLGILTFIFCLLGIFLVRSGILTSVHSFASDPNRGIFIILLFLIIGFFGFGIFAVKSIKIKAKNSEFDLLSKSGFILINNFIFCLALFIVVLGTLYPIILQVFFNSSISIGAPYYSQILTPLVILVLSLMIFVPSLKLQNFKKFNRKTLKKLLISLIISSFCFILLFFIKEYNIYAIICIFLVTFVCIFLIFNLKKRQNISNYLMFLAHFGFCLIILGICVNALFSQTNQLNMSFNEVSKISSYDVKFVGISHDYGKNYLTRIGNFEVSNKSSKFNLNPESRYYPVSDQNTTEAAIKYNLLSDLYIVLGEKNEENNFVVRIYYRPFISFIWIGCLLIFLSGIFRVLKITRILRI